MNPRIKEAYPGQWEELCAAADKFLIDYLQAALDGYDEYDAHPYAWTRVDADVTRGPRPSFRRWMEEADDQLNKGSRSRHHPRPALIDEWWQRRIGDQWKVAKRLWDDSFPGRHGGGWCCRGGAMSPTRCRKCPGS